MSIDLSLHRAAARGEIPKLKELLTQGLDVNCQDESGATPLFAAAFKSRVDAVQLLIEHGANVNLGNSVSYTPLMTAAREKSPEIVKRLLKAGADAELESDAGYKAIHWSLFDVIPHWRTRPVETESITIGVMRALLDAGVNINSKGRKGNTPLMDAAWWALVDVTRFLLREGADKELLDCEEKRAINYAEAKLARNLDTETNDRCREIIKLLSAPSQRTRWKFWK